MTIEVSPLHIIVCLIDIIFIAIICCMVGYRRGRQFNESKPLKHKATICDSCGLHKVFWKKWSCAFATASRERRMAFKKPKQ